MKLLIIAFLGATIALAQECTSPLVPTNTECSMTDASGEKVPVEDVSTCKTYAGCCVSNGQCMVCDCLDNKGNANKGDKETKDLENEYYAGVDPLRNKAKAANSRSLGLLPPIGIPQQCLPPVPFPGNCKPQRNEPFVLEPPNNVPYCVRIPCNPQNNKPYDNSHRMCGMQPGCYFDKPLFEYRQAFGPSVLPGVPVCHLAIRNKVFQTKAREVVAKYGSWNPYFTNCLLREFNDEIRKGPSGCELIPVLEAFHAIPKMAGWKNINPYACALIDACWRPGQGCFYPVDISNVRVKSGERSISVVRKEEVYGRPKCQSFDNSSPVAILRSYHRCLSAGCSVDYSITRKYYTHLFSIGSSLIPKNHWDYWNDVGKGLVGPYNIPRVLAEYGYSSQKSRTTMPPTTTTDNPFGFPFAPVAPGGGIFSPPGIGRPSISPPKKPCGPAHKLYGGRPCPPGNPGPGKKTTYCPYKPFFVPRFKPLTGSFVGCCEINLCYLPKKEISNMHSGAAHYYTEWTMFSPCSVTCGVGAMKRYRKCISQDRSRCTDKEVDQRACHGQYRVCGRWGPWGNWSPCGRTCFPGGNQVRRRRCFPQGARCDGHDEEARSCNEHSCHDNGAPGFPGSWGEWQGGQCQYLGQGRCQKDTIRYCMYNGQFAGNCRGSSRSTQKYRCSGC